jgi:electron transfer flavoprotein alpha subunit
MSIVFCSFDRGRDGVPAGAEEVLTLGRKLAAARGVDLDWLVIGALPERAAAVAARHGVAHIDHVAAAGGGRADALVAALAGYCAQRAPALVLMTQTFDARLVAPRCAGRIGAGVVMNAVHVDVSSGVRVTATAYGGDTRVEYQLGAVECCVIGVVADALLSEAAAQPSAPETRAVAVDLGGVEERVRVVVAAKTEGPRLEDAQIIVAGGRGLQDAANYSLVEDLAAALGGQAGASRPIVDDGWTDSAHQVGLTGKITRPVLYIAAGISGASQHMVGCAAAKTLVAINKDADAAIFKYARYGIVGDCLEVLPALTKAVKGG